MCDYYYIFFRNVEQENGDAQNEEELENHNHENKDCVRGKTVNILLKSVLLDLDKSKFKRNAIFSSYQGFRVFKMYYCFLLIHVNLRVYYFFLLVF